MRRHNKTWTEQELVTMRKLHKAGSTDREIAQILGRSWQSVRQQRSRKRAVIKTAPSQASLQFVEAHKGAKYTRYMKPSTEVSILWGLIKYTKG